MMRPPPITTRTYTPFPSTTLFRSRLADGKALRDSARSPFLVLGELCPEWTDYLEICAPTEKIGGHGKALRSHIILLVEGEHFLEGLRRGQRTIMADADHHPAPHNIVAFQSRNAVRQPFRIGQAVAISESQYVSARLCDAAIACWASALFRHDHHAHPLADQSGQPNIGRASGRESVWK